MEGYYNTANFIMRKSPRKKKRSYFPPVLFMWETVDPKEARVIELPSTREEAIINHPHPLTPFQFQIILQLTHFIAYNIISNEKTLKNLSNKKTPKNRCQAYIPDITQKPATPPAHQSMRSLISRNLIQNTTDTQFRHTLRGGEVSQVSQAAKFLIAE